MTAVLASPFGIDCVTTERIADTASSNCSSASMPARFTAGPDSLIRPRASASDIG